MPRGERACRGRDDRGRHPRIRKAAGDRHPVLIWPHYMWAEALLSIGRNQEALAVYRDTVDLCRSIYGDRHRAVGLTKLRMARPLVLTDEVAEAEAVLREALEIFRYEDGNLANRDNCLDELLNLLHADHRSPDMARLCRQELAGARAIKENKESAAYLISVLRKTALAEEMVGNWDAAYAAQQEAIDRSTHSSSATDPLIAEMLLEAARVALAQGSGESYRAICRRLIDSFAPSAPPELSVIVATGTVVPDSVADPAQL